MILLDTCAFLWLVSQQDMLSKRAFELIEKNSDNLFISSISAFEIGIKHRKGRILLPQEPEKGIPQALSFHGTEPRYENSYSGQAHPQLS